MFTSYMYYTCLSRIECQECVTGLPYIHDLMIDKLTVVHDITTCIGTGMLEVQRRCYFGGGGCDVNACSRCVRCETSAISWSSEHVPAVNCDMKKLTLHVLRSCALHNRICIPHIKLNCDGAVSVHNVKRQLSGGNGLVSIGQQNMCLPQTCMRHTCTRNCLALHKRSQALEAHQRNASPVSQPQGRGV